jgi:competence protein ComEC
LDGKVPVERILAGEPGEIPGGAALPCRAGTDWSWDGVAFELLYPFDAGLEGNDSSCVLRVSTGGASVLLTGDVGVGVEAHLVAKESERLRSTLLVAAHHGSNTSTGTEFLEAVAPLYVLYSAGLANRFGFPAEAVRERVTAFGAEQINTARAGAIAFRLRADGVEGPWTYRAEEGRLWNHRVAEADGSF